MNTDLKELDAAIDECAIADRHRFRRALHRLARQKKPTGLATQSDELAQQIAISRAGCEARAAAIPGRISYPPELPVSGAVERLRALLEQHQVLIVAGETGSGKTTQLPKVCLEAGFGRYGLIGHTQPRRLAAVSVADRIAEELGVAVGEGVGYQVRFNERMNEQGFLKLMTDGILLAEIVRDRFLNRYELLIIDEAHERSLNIDFLLGYLRRLLPRRRDLKLIITSATIDVERFSKHFDGAPVVSVEGRSYPVTTEYWPPEKRGNDVASSEILLDKALEAIATLHQDNPIDGSAQDILVFLSSEREIRDLATLLRKRRLKDLEVLPLYARLRHSEQVKVFQGHKGRRVVLATNVAETSITVPGVRYVVDTGQARISRYSPASKVQRLPIEPVSQASANQRQGRCGRIAPGKCIRLYSEADFDSRAEFTDPEIKRTNLAAVILRMCSLELGEVADFPFLDQPESAAINEGYRLLAELNALTSDKSLTPIGQAMSKLPVDPRYGRMLVEANRRDCLREMLIVISALSAQDPRELNGENRDKARQVLAEYDHAESDFLSLVNLWHSFEKERQRMSRRELEKFCRRQFLSFSRMREWRELHRQLLLSCRGLGWELNKAEGSYEAIHRSLLCGFLNQVAQKTEGNEFVGSRNRKFKLLSTSTLSKSSPPWIITGDLIETEQTFASMAARVQPQWIEDMALHLVKRECLEPHWSIKAQRVMANERVRLFGLVLTERNQVPYDEVDRDAAREIFIQDGLARRSVNSKARAYVDNLRFLDELAAQEEKLRRPDLLLSETDVAQFYAQRLPENVVDTASFNAWLKRGAEQEQRSKLISLRGAGLDRSAELADRVAAFPERASIRKNELAIDYRFDPSSPEDGATLSVPLELLPQIGQADLDWAVPGLLRERCIFLLKSLPKALRKNFIPVSGFVDRLLPAMSSADGSLVDGIITQVRLSKGLELREEDFKLQEMPAYLRGKIRVLDSSGKTLAADSDLRALKQRFEIGEDVSAADMQSTDYSHPLERDSLEDWDFDELPLSVDVETADARLTLQRYPALTVQGERLSLRLVADEKQAAEQNRLGLALLLQRRSRSQFNSIRKSFKRFRDGNALLLAALPGLQEEQFLQQVYDSAFELYNSRPISRADFEGLLERGKPKLIPTAERLQATLLEIIHSVQELRRQLSQRLPPSLDYARQDIEGQLQQLFPDDLLQTVDPQHLSDYPRYLKGIEHRLSKAPHLGSRDEAHVEELRGLWRRFERLCEGRDSSRQAPLRELRWMLEEYRLSLFAQQIKTRVPVSAKRLEKAFAAISGRS